MYTHKRVLLSRVLPFFVLLIMVTVWLVAPVRGQVSGVSGGPSYDGGSRTDCCDPAKAFDGNTQTFWAGANEANVPGGQWSLQATYQQIQYANSTISVQYYDPYYPGSAELYISRDGRDFTKIADVPSSSAVSAPMEFIALQIRFYSGNVTPPYIREVTVIPGPALQCGQICKLGGLYNCGPTMQCVYATQRTFFVCLPSSCANDPDRCPCTTPTPIQGGGGSGNTQDKAFDGDLNTYWQGDNNSTTWQLQHTYGSTQPASSRIAIYYQESYYPTSAKLYTSKDGTNWTLVGDIPNQPVTLFTAPTDFNRIRIDFVGTRGNPPAVREVTVSPLSASVCYIKPDLTTISRGKEQVPSSIPGVQFERYFELTPSNNCTSYAVNGTKALVTVYVTWSDSLGRHQSKITSCFTGWR